MRSMVRFSPSFFSAKPPTDPFSTPSASDDGYEDEEHDEELDDDYDNYAKFAYVSFPSSLPFSRYRLSPVSCSH